MASFKCKRENGIVITTIKSAIVVGTYCFITSTNILDIPLIYYILYLCALYFYIAITNYDIDVYQDRMEISNHLLLIFKKDVFYFKDIRQVTLKYFWIEIFLKNVSKLKPKFLAYTISVLIWPISGILPSEYKWIKINTRKRNYYYYCFGIEYEAYDNPGPHFEELHVLLRHKGFPTVWDIASKNL